ncbi:MAG: hypothetical protein LJE93_00845 [Acidobacteria bacterium]|nr:hypothetical protein [Acidobacteriota bacterium]
MSNGQQAHAKQGLPAWAWIGIGCGALMILVAVATMIGGYIVANKAKHTIAEFEENPAGTIARGIIKASPDLEEVSSDDEAGTITVRNTKTGEVITVNYDEITEGKLSFTTDEGEITFDASEAKESGTIKVTDEQGGVVFATGEAVSDEVPEWVPIFPGGEPKNRHGMRTGERITGGFEIETSASVEEVIRFYQEALESAGFEVKTNAYTQAENKGGMVNGDNDDEDRNVVAIIHSEGDGMTSIVMTYTGG